jgi:hypothetical protein
MSPVPFCEWVRRLAERTLDRATFETVIVPALADVRHECGEERGARVPSRRVQVRACWGVLKAFAVCLVGAFARDTRETGSVMSARALLLVPLVCLALFAPEIPLLVRLIDRYGATSTLVAEGFRLPSMLVFAIPIAFFFAVAVHRDDTRTRARLVPGMLGSALACSVVLGLLILGVTPNFNQRYRQHMYDISRSLDPTVPARALPKGLAEMTWRDLQDTIAQPASVAAARAAREHLNERFAAVPLAFVLGLLALSLGGWWRSRFATIVMGSASLYLFGWTWASAVQTSSVGPIRLLGPWLVHALFVCVAVILLWWSSRLDGGGVGHQERS